MTYINNQDVDIADLVCTPACHLELNTPSHSSALSGRERQFCMLLSRKDDFSLQVCKGMADKVNFDSLVQQGYIQSVATLTTANSIDFFGASDPDQGFHVSEGEILDYAQHLPA